MIRHKITRRSSTYESCLIDIEKILNSMPKTIKLIQILVNKVENVFIGAIFYEEQ